MIKVVHSLDCKSPGSDSNPGPALTSFSKTLIHIFHSPPRCKWIPDMLERYTLPPSMNWIIMLQRKERICVTDYYYYHYYYYCYQYHYYYYYYYHYPYYYHYCCYYFIIIILLLSLLLLSLLSLL